MRRKLGIYVCPEDECAVMGRPGGICRRHDRALMRCIYVRQTDPQPQSVASEKQKRTLQSILDKAPHSIRGQLEAQARKMGYL